MGPKNFTLPWQVSWEIVSVLTVGLSFLVQRADAISYTVKKKRVRKTLIPYLKLNGAGRIFAWLQGDVKVCRTTEWEDRWMRHWCLNVFATQTHVHANDLLTITNLLLKEEHLSFPAITLRWLAKEGGIVFLVLVTNRTNSFDDNWLRIKTPCSRLVKHVVLFVGGLGWIPPNVKSRPYSRYPPSLHAP